MTEMLWLRRQQLLFACYSHRSFAESCKFKYRSRWKQKKPKSNDAGLSQACLMRRTNPDANFDRSTEGAGERARPPQCWSNRILLFQTLPNLFGPQQSSKTNGYIGKLKRPPHDVDSRLIVSQMTWNSQEFGNN